MLALIKTGHNVDVEGLHLPFLSVNVLFRLVFIKSEDDEIVK